jgi:hypothetical protein
LKSSPGLEYTLKKEKLKSTDYADFVWRSIIAPEQRSFRQAAGPSFILVLICPEAEKEICVICVICGFLI